MRILWLKPIVGAAAAYHLGPELFVANRDGIAAIFPAATSFVLFGAAIFHDRAPFDRRIIGWFWLWTSCCFANRPLRDMGWPTWPVEWLLAALVISLAGRLVWRLLREPGRSVLRWPAVALVATVAVAFLWPESTPISAIIAGGSLVYGLTSCLAIASLFIFKSERTAHG